MRIATSVLFNSLSLFNNGLIFKIQKVAGSLRLPLCKNMRKTSVEIQENRELAKIYTRKNKVFHSQ